MHFSINRRTYLISFSLGTTLHQHTHSHGGGGGHGHSHGGQGHGHAHGDQGHGHSHESQGHDNEGYNSIKQHLKSPKSASYGSIDVENGSLAKHDR